jgi:ribosomal protein S18 acetylase RimI-like enzyme
LGSDSINIRLLDISYVDNIAVIHRSAFPNSLLTKLSFETTSRYYRWQIEGPHKSVILGAFEKDKLVGFLVGGLFNGSFSGFISKNRSYLIIQLLLHPWLLSSLSLHTKFLRFLKLITRSKSKNAQSQKGETRVRDSFGVLSIAVHPEFQGWGIGRELMLEVERIALNNSFTKLDLTVSTENQKNIEFYESLGFSKSLSSDNAWTGHMFKNIGNPRF